MPPATAEKVRSGQERLNTIFQDGRNALRQYLLKYGAEILAANRRLEQDLLEWLREGVEKGALLDVLATVRPQVEHVEEMFRRGLAIFEGDADFESQLNEVSRFLEWVRSLETRFSAPAPPFDYSRLPPPPTGPAGTAEGYVSIDEAITRVRSGKKG